MEHSSVTNVIYSTVVSGCQERQCWDVCLSDVRFYLKTSYVNWKYVLWRSIELRLQCEFSVEIKEKEWHFRNECETIRCVSTLNIKHLR